MPAQRETIGGLFARLTSELEDTCELAVEGQNPRLSQSQYSTLLVRIRSRLSRIGSILETIDTQIERSDGEPQ